LGGNRKKSAFSKAVDSIATKSRETFPLSDGHSKVELM
jgi:hypothetical protein